MKGILAAFGSSSVVAVAVVGAAAVVARRGLVGAVLSRKLVHIATGLCYAACLALYPTDRPFAAAAAAAVVPAVATLLFAAAGLGLGGDRWGAPLVAAMSRSGDPAELLRGPLFYGAAHVAATLLFGTASPATAAVIAFLCAGDGLAEVAGLAAVSSRSPLARHLPWSSKKTLAGTAAFFAGGLAAALVLISVRPLTAPRWAFDAPNLAKLAGIAAAAAFAESATDGDYDNIWVAATTAALAYLAWY